MSAVPSSTWKHVGIALATLAGLSISASVIWALYGNVFLPVSRLLPANTALLVSDANPETLRTLKAWFPPLNRLPEVPPRATIAFLPLNGTLEWVMLTPAGTLQAQPYKIDASSQHVKALLNAPQNTLEYAQKYVSLLPAKRIDSTWVYADPALLGSGALALPWLHTTSAMAIALSPEELDLSVADDSKVGLPTFVTQLPLAFEHPIAVVRTHNPQLSLTKLAQSVDPTLSLLLRSKWEGLLRSSVGSNISPTYDILPLLQGETTLHIAAGSGSHYAFLAEGEADNLQANVFEDILKSFTASLPAFHRETLMFEKGFSFDALSQDKTAIDARSFSLEGWNVRSVRHKATDHTLTVALRGKEWMISNSLPALEARINRTFSIVRWHDIDGSLIAAGLIDPSRGNDLASALAGTHWQLSLPLPSTMHSPLVWTLTKQQRRMTLHMEVVKSTK